MYIVYACKTLLSSLYKLMRRHPSQKEACNDAMQILFTSQYDFIRGPEKRVATLRTSLDSRELSNRIILRLI